MHVVTTRKVMTADCLHHASLSDGVRSPRNAKIMFDIPTTDPDEKYQDMVAQIYAVIKVFHPNFLPRPNMSHMDSALAARWKMLTWKK